eukprot:3818336-Pleurochrysis_carterae.AAC.1
MSSTAVTRRRRRTGCWTPAHDAIRDVASGQLVAHASTLVVDLYCAEATLLQVCRQVVFAFCPAAQ